MKKTTFAGLTELDISESILEDNGAFTGRDRVTTDRFIQIGAKTHRHDGSEGIGNPTNAPSATVVASGGTLEAELSMSVGYTAQDDQRGETLLSPVSVVTTEGPLSAPVITPSAVVDYEAGSLVQDNYYYGITYVDSEGGETPLGPVAVAIRQPGYENARVLLSGLNANMEAAGATAWRLYRQRSGGVFAYLASGTVSEYEDDGSVSPICDTNPPSDNFNTTNSINSLLITLPEAGDLPEETEFINVYLSQTGEFSGQTFLEQYPVSSAGATILFTALELEDQQPPDVNTSIGGAAKIDPDTELEDWPWKRAVKSFASLPEPAEHGDVRVVLDEDKAYEYTSENAWKPFSGGGGASSTGKIDVLASGQIGYKDNFETEELDSNWEEFTAGIYPEPATIGLSEGALVPESQGGAIKRKDISIVDGRSKLRFRKLKEGEAQVALIPKHIDDENFIALALYGPENKLYEAWAQVGGEFVEIEEDSIAYEFKIETDYWITGEIDGTTIIFNVWDEDPDLGTATALLTIEKDMAAEAESVMVGTGNPGLAFLDEEGGLEVDNWQYEGHSYASNAARLVFDGDVVDSVEHIAGDAIVTLASAVALPNVAASGTTVENVGDIEVLGSGGIWPDLQEPESGKAELTIEGDRKTLGQEGMGVIIHGSDPNVIRPNKFRLYTWFGSVEPVNMTAYDTWIEV